MEWLLRKEEENNEAVFAFELDVFKKQNTLAVPRDAKFVITWRRYFRIAGNANPTVRVSGTDCDKRGSLAQKRKRNCHLRAYTMHF